MGHQEQWDILNRCNLVHYLKLAYNRLSPDQRPHFAALIGSRGKEISRTDSDIDLLVILNSNQTPLTLIRRKLEGLKHLTDAFQAPEIQRFFSLVCVPSFALIQHSIEMAARNKRGEFLIVHLLAYPSFKHLQSWEHDIVIRGYCGGVNHENLICGDIAEIARIFPNTNSDFSSAYSYLLAKFHEAYLHYLYIQEYDVDFAIKFGFKHLRYCVKHLAVQYLLHTLSHLPEKALSWQDILDSSEKLPGHGKELIEELDLIRPDAPKKAVSVCGPKMLARLYHDAWELFSDCAPT